MPMRPTRAHDADPTPTPAGRSGWLHRVTGRFRSDADAAPAAAPPANEASVLDALPDAVVVVDADGRVQTANRAVEGVLGRAPGALAGADFAEAALAPDAHEPFRDRLRACATGDAGGASERADALDADGSAVPVELSVRPVPGAGLVVVSLRDARPARAAEAALAAAEGRQRMLRTIVDAIPDPVVAVDREGGVVWRNRAGARGPGGQDRTLPEAERAAAGAAIRSGSPDVDREEPGPDGGVRLTTRIPVLDRSGAVAGLVAISRDVTAQKEAEAQLVRDKQAAEAAAQANSDLLATTSHEIRTLMNGVTGMTNLLLDTDLDDEQRDFVDTVQSSSDALLTVINDVLDFSKAEAGLLALEDRPCDVRQVARDGLSMVGQQASAKGLALACEVGDGVPETILGDSTRIQQVLSNLLSNAVKFTDEGSVRVRVRADASAGDGPAVAFEVEDTGVGIAPDRLDAVFERFTQADESTSRTHGGSGLGLAICRQLVEMMGGELAAASEPGVGSTFRFTVPARVADAAPAAPPPAGGDTDAAWVARPAADAAAAAEAPAAPPADEVGRPDRAVVLPTDAMVPAARVLLAEDNPVNQKVALLTLRRLGYTPDVVSDGAQAVEAVRRHPYDVVLMDIMMPVMGGLEATRRIRTDPGPHPPPAIVALTANAMTGDRERCLEAGCDDYLSKPVAPRYLAATIEKAVRTRAAVTVGA